MDNNKPGHSGSWNILGMQLPDYGVTEGIGNLIGGGRTAQGGSNLLSPQVQQYAQYPVQWATGGASGIKIGKGGESRVLGAQAPEGPFWPDTDSSKKITDTGNKPVQKTGGNTGGGGGGGDWGSAWAEYQRRGWNNEASAKADWEAKGRASMGGGGEGGGGGQSIEDLISEQYGPALQALRDIETSLLGGKNEALGNVAADFASGQQTIGNEQTELERSLSEQGRRLGESARSAYADATRAYNNLIQQGMSRFGAGSSAGGAVQELVNQEFLRSRGAMGQQEIQGQQDLGMEQTKLTNYISQKKSDLEKWQRDAVSKINENFINSMNEINSRKADIEANKTRDRIAALQSAVSQAQEVKNADRQYRMGLAQFAVEQMQTFANRAFTPQEIAAVVNQMMTQELGTFSQNTGGTPQVVQNPLTSKRGGQYDEFGNLKNPVTNG